jgi:hypothetical protein
VDTGTGEARQISALAGFSEKVKIKNKKDGILSINNTLRFRRRFVSISPLER